MSIAIWALFIAYLMPYGFAVAAKSGGGLDNAKPREYLAQLRGWRQRAHWTQLNHFENFPPFAAAVIVAILMQAPVYWVNFFAVGFVVARLLYGFCYLTNRATARSLVWSIAQCMIIGLFLLVLL